MPRESPRNHQNTDTAALIETHYGRVAPPSIQRLRIEGLSRLLWALFFALTVGLIPILVQAGSLLLAFWGVALPLLALGVTVVFSRLELENEKAPADARRAFRAVQEEKLFVVLLVFIVCSLAARAGLVLQDFTRELAWLLCYPPLVQFFRLRRWSALFETGILVGTVIVIQTYSGNAAVVVLAVGVAMAWACRGLAELTRSRQRESA